ncbi:MAG: hypothetical protein ACRDHF_13460 [Tepidiformaceae bacterium]
MADAELLRRAAAAALAIPHDEVVPLSGSEVRARGERWRVSSSALHGLDEGECPDVLIVSPVTTDDPEAAVWVAPLHNSFRALSNADTVAELFSRCDSLPAETLARLIAINLGPLGAEAVVVRDDELDVVLGSRSPVVPRGERVPRLIRDSSGGWQLQFVSYRTYKSGGGLLASVAAWRAVFEGAVLSLDRTEIISDAPFPPG